MRDTSLSLTSTEMLTSSPPKKRKDDDDEVFLKTVGVNSHRCTIIAALLEKTTCFFPECFSKKELVALRRYDHDLGGGVEEAERAGDEEHILRESAPNMATQRGEEGGVQRNGH